jgi:hypothetical protein
MVYQKILMLQAQRSKSTARPLDEEQMQGDWARVRTQSAFCKVAACCRRGAAHVSKCARPRAKWSEILSGYQAG